MRKIVVRAVIIRPASVEVRVGQLSAGPIHGCCCSVGVENERLASCCQSEKVKIFGVWKIDVVERTKTWNVRVMETFTQGLFPEQPFRVSNGGFRFSGSGLGLDLVLGSGIW